MKINVKAKISDRKLFPIEAEECISKHKKYEVKCKIDEENLGLFITTYDLLLEGEHENIKSFIGYLRMKGFKVKEF